MDQAERAEVRGMIEDGANANANAPSLGACRVLGAPLVLIMSCLMRVKLSNSCYLFID